MNKIDIIVLGTGMYVTGRNESGPGVIASSLFQFSKVSSIEITFVCKNKASLEQAKIDLKKINNRINNHCKYKIIQLSKKIDFKKFIASNSFDAAIIALPDHEHYFYTKILIEKEVSPLVVKPLTDSLDKHKHLIKLSKQFKVFNSVEFHKRFDTQNLYVKYNYKKIIGETSYIQVDYSQRLTVPRFTFKKWIKKTNIFQYLGVHYIDLIIFFTKAKPLELVAVGSTGVLSKTKKIYDSINVIIKWKKNNHHFNSVINVNWIDPTNSPAMSDQRLKIIGSNGRVELDQRNRGIFINNPEIDHTYPNPYFYNHQEDEKSKFLNFSGYAYESINKFLNFVLLYKSKKKIDVNLLLDYPTFQNTLDVAKVNEAVKISLEKNKWVKIDDLS